MTIANDLRKAGKVRPEMPMLHSLVGEERTSIRTIAHPRVRCRQLTQRSAAALSPSTNCRTLS